MVTTDIFFGSAQFSIKNAGIKFCRQTFCFASISKFLSPVVDVSLSKHTHFAGFVYEVVKGSYLPQNWLFWFFSGEAFSMKIMEIFYPKPLDEKKVLWEKFSWEVFFFGLTTSTQLALLFYFLNIPVHPIQVFWTPNGEIISASCFCRISAIMNTKFYYLCDRIFRVYSCEFQPPTPRFRFRKFFWQQKFFGGF